MVKKWTKTYSRKWRRKRFKKLIDQVFRMKLDFGSVAKWPLNSGAIGFDSRGGNSSVQFETVYGNSIEMDSNTNFFTQFFGKKKVYGVKIEATPLRTNTTVNGISVYIGYLLGRNSSTPGIDTARGLSTAYPLPSFGAGTLSKFVRINTLPWLDITDQLAGTFFICSNTNTTQGDTPQWEIRLSLYMKFKCNTT